ncbi:MAG: hypothetical protein VX022_01655 [Candidatus Thermoplasmatota archaeon]|nr:hypothetical protein [Candidatus Thermoplasmatota archaeon]
MLENVKSMPAKVLLIISLVIGLLYAVNFIFFSSCSVVNGDGCTALIPNGADPDHESYGKSAGTLYVVGALALGTSLGTTLILNEGARGKWTIMIPTIMGFTALVIVLAPPFQGDYVSASNNPLYASFIALACYTGAYFLLKEEGVDEGLENFKLRIRLKNEAKYAIGASVTIGTLYTLNHLFFADGYAGAGGTTIVPGFEDGSYWPDSENFNPASTTPLSFRVLAAFFVVLVSMGLVLLTQGAKGNWPVAHISLFSVTFFTLAVIIGAVVNNDQVIPAGPYEGTYTPDDSTNTSNIAVCALVLFLNVYGYYKMREEGVEEGMTFGGKDFGNSDDFLFKMYPAVTAVYVVLLLIANYVTQPL